jgi:hypothetical protein
MRVLARQTAGERVRGPQRWRYRGRAAGSDIVDSRRLHFRGPRRLTGGAHSLSAHRESTPRPGRGRRRNPTCQGPPFRSLPGRADQMASSVSLGMEWTTPSACIELATW